MLPFSRALKCKNDFKTIILTEIQSFCSYFIQQKCGFVKNKNKKTASDAQLITHAFSGSMNQSSSHSHPLGGMKYSCFNFSLPVTSENLWRPTSPVVPHFPNT